VHRQKQEGRNWIGVVLPVGRLSPEQMRGLAKISRDLGDGDIRLTVWQNLLISGVADDQVKVAEAAIEARVELDGPVNIHLTGCHHSCAQHYIGDVGLLACKVEGADDASAVEGYHVLVGGGFGPKAALAREIYRDVKAEDAPPTIERMLKAYLANRASADETFHAFTRRHDIEALKTMFAGAAT
jgi:ferredoxin-nitrite reductase